MQDSADQIVGRAKVGQPPRAIHPEDHIYRYLADAPHPGKEGARDYYFADGRNSAERLRDIVASDTAVDTGRPWSLLEFASGYGCVTRHLPVVIPEAEVVACDIHSQAIDFLRNELGAKAMLSTSAPENLDLGRQFDVVFALSFFSHMPDRTFGPWLEALFRHVRPGGSLIFTTHGKTARQKTMDDTCQFSEEGYWFHPSSDQLDLDVHEYGTTMSNAKYVTRQIYRRLRAPIALLSEGEWWTIQDLYVVAKPDR